MAVTYQAVFQAAGTTAATVSVSWPTHLTDDVGILVVESDVGTAFATPTGWTAVNGTTAAGTAGTTGTQLGVWWQRATSSSMGAAVVSLPTGGNHLLAAIYTFRGCVTSGSPVNASGSASKTVASTSYSAPSITTTAANCLVLYCVTRGNDNASTLSFTVGTNANLTSISEIDETGTTIGNGGGFVIGAGTKAVAGATGATTGTVTSSANASVSLALEPNTLSELICAQNSFTLAGTSTLLQAAFKLNNTLQTYLLGSNNLILNRTAVIDASVQTYAVNGTTTGLLLNRQLVSQTGTFSIAGVDVILQYNSSGVAFTLDTVVGAYSLTGTTLTLSKQVSLDLQAGTYSLFGNTLGFIRALALNSVPGSFSVSGKDAVFSLTKRFSLTTGTYTVSGNNAEVNRFYQLNNQPGTYQVVGSGLDYFSSRNLVTLPLDIVADFRSVGNFFWYQTTQTIQPVKYKITKRNEFILGRQTHMGRRGL